MQLTIIDDRLHVEEIQNISIRYLGVYIFYSMLFILFTKYRVNIFVDLFFVLILFFINFLIMSNSNVSSV